MSPSPSRPSPPGPSDPPAAATERTPAKSAPAEPAAADRTERQQPSQPPPAADVGATLVRPLPDRLLSEDVSRRMQTAGYKLIRSLGEGTYGVVWLAEEESTGIRVAIKFFAHGAGRRWELLQEEVRQLAALDLAQGIVHLKDAVADADPPYYVMSFAEGGSLAQRLEKGPLPAREATAIFRDVVHALAYVHAHGIRHCDLKPGNILLDQMGRPLVADFGQAHLSDDATPALGTFFYMAPEQADLAGRIPDTRWDVYGLGALFYAMLTGEPPRKDAALNSELQNTLELGHRLRRYREGIAGTPPPTAHRRVRGVDGALAAVIDGCLEIDPKKRLASAEAILDALEKRRLRRRQRPLLALGGVAPLLIILAMSAVGWFVAEQQIEAAKTTLVNQVLENDAASARMAASGLDRGFRRRMEVLEGILKADGKDWPRLVADAAAARRAAAADPSKAADLKEYRSQLKQWLKETAEDQLLYERYRISGLSVADRDGYILMSITHEQDWEPEPEFERTWDARSWSWRDWFSGRGNQPESGHYPPLTVPHISQPYLSTDQIEKVEITVPVTVAGEPGGPAAVLTGSMKWADVSMLLDQLTFKKGQLAAGQVAVFNERGQFLKHGDRPVLDGVRDYRDNPHVYDGLRAVLVADRNTLEAYADPFDGKTYLAGYKTFDPYQPDEVGDDEPGAAGRWGVVVQHDRAEVLQPIDSLYGRLKVVGTWTLVGAGVFTGGFWMGLIWLLRRQERLGHG